MTPYLRPATPNDADSIAKLAIEAGEGLPASIWKGMARSSDTPMSVGVRLAKKDHGTFSWANAVVAEVDGEIAGMMISHITAETAEPFSEETHPTLRPILSLENQALETRFISLIATFSDFHGQRVAKHLAKFAYDHKGKCGLSAVVTDNNEAGLNFYQELGFELTANAPVISTNWDTDSQRWHLLTKS